jgi:hypothetical protein
MLNVQYQIYTDSTLSLAETIVVKFSDAASAINYLVMSKLGETSVNLEEPTTWKYYQNIEGSYHLSDTRMTVVSIDTQVEMEFNKANLSVSPLTRVAYEYGQKKYRELVSLYPDQEQLILGILYPANINEAIAAKDGTILNYPSFLIEDNEYTLISKLQEWIYKYIYRWVNTQFSISDDLYVAAYIAQLHLNMVQALFTFRLEACKTNEAHSFHIRQYLASHNRLDKYLDNLTKEQSLFLYRNILYIQRNCGSVNTFEWLIENLLTNRNIYAYNFSMRHNLENMIASDLISVNSLYPEIGFLKKPLNLASDSIDKSLHTLDYIIKDINPVAIGNPDYHLNNKQIIREQLEDSKSGVVATKILQTYTVEHPLDTDYNLEDVLFNHWINWGLNNNYSGNIILTLPKDKSKFVLSILESVILFTYCIYKSRNITLTTLPDIITSRIVRSPLPSLNEIKQKIETSYYKDSKIQRQIDTMIESYPVENTEDFYSECYNIFEANRQNYLINTCEGNILSRGYAQACSYLLFHDVLVNNQNIVSNYDQWLIDNGFDFSNYLDSDYFTLAAVVLNEATGISKHKKKSIKDIQSTMVEILKKLSSYSILISQESDTTGLFSVSARSIRANTVLTEEKTDAFVNVCSVDVIKHNDIESGLITLDTSNLLSISVLTSSNSNKYSLDPTVYVSSNESTSHSSYVKIANITIKEGVADVIIPPPPPPPPVEAITTYYGMDTFGELHFGYSDNGMGGFYPGNTPLQRETLQPQVQKALFKANLSNTISEYTFETDTFGDAAPLSLTFNGTLAPITATLTGGFQVENRVGLGDFNTTVGGENWFETDSNNDLNIAFNTDICAFGMYITDLGDTAGGNHGVIRLTLTDNLGVTSVISTPDLSGTPSGSNVFFGFVSNIAKYRHIKIENTIPIDNNSEYDLYGIDDLIVADQGQCLLSSGTTPPPVTPLINPYSSLIDITVNTSILTSINPVTVAAATNNVVMILDSNKTVVATPITTTSGWNAFGLNVGFVLQSTTHLLNQASAIWFHAENFGSGIESSTTIPVLENELYRIRINVYMTFGNTPNGQLSIDSGWHDRVDLSNLPTNGWVTCDVYVVATSSDPTAKLRFTLPPNRPTGEYYIELLEFSKINGSHLYQPDPLFQPTLQVGTSTRYVHFVNNEFMIELNPAATIYTERKVIVDIDTTGQSGLNITYTN